MSNLEKLGDRIRYYRLLRGLTQKEMAGQLGVSPRYIGHIEQGHRGASLDMLVEICKFFSISMAEIIPVEKPPSLNGKEELIHEITVVLWTLEQNQVQDVKKMVCSLCG